MKTYESSIYSAVLLFPFIAALCTLPYMIYSYRKYGAVSILRSFVLFGFLFYLLCAYFLVILPLPSRESVAKMTGPTTDLVPFNFVRNFVNSSGFLLRDTSTYLPALKSFAFLEPLFNLALTIPFGIFLSYYFKDKLPKIILLTFLLSLFFELTQLSGLYGIYARPYRLFSIDDLVLNTSGGVLGYFLGLGFRRILPSKQRMDEKSAKVSGKVSYIRHFIASAIDFVVVLLLNFILAPFIGYAVWALYPVILIYFVSTQMLCRGRTLGKFLVNIRIEAYRQKSPFIFWLMLRYMWVILSLAIPEWLVNWFSQSKETWQAIVVLAIVCVIGMLYFISWVIGFFKQKRLWYEAFSNTKLVSTFTYKGLEEEREGNEVVLNENTKIM